MPKISRITVAKKRKDRFHIYLSKENGKEEYGFTVSEDLFIKHSLNKGMDISEADINKIKEEGVLDKAFQKTLNFLSYRMRSEKEILQYLREQEVERDDAEQLMERLRDLNFLDDLAFAEAFVRTKKNSQKKGPLLIEQELYQKGISQKHIGTAMLQYPPEEQLDNAIAAAEKKQSSYSSEGARKKQQKLMQFLIQRGFTSETAKQALAESDTGATANEEWEALLKQGAKAEKKYSKYEDGWEKDQRIKQFLYGRGFSMELIDKWLQQKEE